MNRNLSFLLMVSLFGVCAAQADEYYDQSAWLADVTNHPDSPTTIDQINLAAGTFSETTPVMGWSGYSVETFTAGNFKLTDTIYAPYNDNENMWLSDSSLIINYCPDCSITFSYTGKPIYGFGANWSFGISTGLMIDGYDMPDPSHWTPDNETNGIFYSFNGFYGISSETAYPGAIAINSGDLQSPYATEVITLSNVEFAVDGVTPAPEPATWGLMASVFCIGGLCLLRRKKIA